MHSPLLSLSTRPIPIPLLLKSIEASQLILKWLVGGGCQTSGPRGATDLKTLSTEPPLVSYFCNLPKSKMDSSQILLEGRKHPSKSKEFLLNQIFLATTTNNSTFSLS